MISLLQTVLAVYLRILKKLGEFVFLMLSAGVISSCIVFPLWYLSTHHLTMYNLLIVILLSVLALFFIGYRIYRLQTQGPGVLYYIRTTVEPILLKIISSVVFIVFLYGIVWFFAKGITIVGIAAAFLFIISLSGVVYWSTTHAK